MSTYVRKTRDVFEIHVNYGYGDGWEYECGEETRAEARERLREYRENCPQYPARIVKRRERLECPACHNETWRSPHNCTDGPAPSSADAHERGFEAGYDAAIHDARVPGSRAYHTLHPDKEPPMNG